MTRFHLRLCCGWVAQLVEHATENRSVGGSIPPPATTSSPALSFALSVFLVFVHGRDPHHSLTQNGGSDLMEDWFPNADCDR